MVRFPVRPNRMDDRNEIALAFQVKRLVGQYNWYDGMVGKEAS